MGTVAPGKTRLFEQCACAFERPCRMSEFFIPPAPVARCYQSPKGGAASLIDQPNDRFAVHGGRNRLAELHFAEPFLLPLDLRRGLLTSISQIEKKKVVFESRSGI